MNVNVLLSNVVNVNDIFLSFSFNIQYIYMSHVVRLIKERGTFIHTHTHIIIHTYDINKYEYTRIYRRTGEK